MPATFVFAVIMGIITVLAGAVWFAAHRSAKAAAAKPAPEPPSQGYIRRREPEPGANPGEEIRPYAKGVTITFGALTALFILLSSWTPVGTQNVGVITAFGKPVGDVGNGLHFVAPWDQVTEMDNAIQTDQYEGGACINIRIADQQTACASVRIRWQMRQPAADLLFRNYRTSDGVRTSLVTGELSVALNQQFARYNPIASLTTTAAPGSASNPTIAQLASAVTKQMQSEIGTQVHVFNVLIPLVTYDQAVQSRINTVLAQVAQTDVANQAVKTAAAQATAANDLRAALSNDPNVLVSKCLDLVGEAEKTGYSLPPGFSCFGPSSVGVLANAKS